MLRLLRIEHPLYLGPILVIDPLHLEQLSLRVINHFPFLVHPTLDSPASTHPYNQVTYWRYFGVDHFVWLLLFLRLFYW